MKYRTIQLAVLLSVVALMAGCSVWEPSTTSRQEAAPTFDILDQYGWWVELPGFGTAWQPDVDPSWRPYEYGHWIWTDQGWYWAGYEPFAWIVYHYGYWYRDPQQGWFWLEGHEWSPSRVAWIIGDDYAAWAPLPPPRETLIEPWQEGASSIWAYVPYSGFTRDNPGRASTGQNPLRGARRTSGVNRVGPEVRHVERVVEHSIPERRLTVHEVKSRGESWRKADLPSEDALRVRSNASEVGKVVHRLTPEEEKNGAPPPRRSDGESRPVQTPTVQTPPVQQPSQPQARPAEQKETVRPKEPDRKTDVNQTPPKKEVETPSPPKKAAPTEEKKETKAQEPSPKPNETNTSNN